MFSLASRSFKPVAPLIDQNRKMPKYAKTCHKDGPQCPWRQRSWLCCLYTRTGFLLYLVVLLLSFGLRFAIRSLSKPTKSHSLHSVYSHVHSFSFDSLRYPAYSVPKPLSLSAGCLPAPLGRFLPDSNRVCSPGVTSTDLESGTLVCRRNRFGEAAPPFRCAPAFARFNPSVTGPGARTFILAGCALGEEPGALIIRLPLEVRCIGWSNS